METDGIAKDKQARDEAVFAALNMLAETWPACFKHEDETPVPLAIGTYQRVQAELGEIVDGGAQACLCDLLPTARLLCRLASAWRAARRSRRERGGTRYRRRAGQGDATQEGQGDATR
jgi:hypothetical protein